LMPSRLWELGVGCLLFFGLKQPNKIVYGIQKVPPLLVTTVVLGVLFIPLQFAVSATIAVVVLTAILIACLHSGTAGYYFFTRRPVVYLGLISYSLYLWHWVVLSLSRWTIGIHWWSVPVQVALMLLVSIASYRYIETPLRRSDWSILQWKSIGYGLGASASAAVFLIVLETSLGNQMFLGDPDASGLLPKPAAAASGTNISLENCTQESDIVFKLCDAPAIGSSVRMLVLGDSHSAQLFPLFARLRQEYGIGLTAYIVGANRPAQVFPPIPNLGRGVSSRTEWNRINAYPLKFLDRFISNAKSGDIIFLGSRLGGHFGTGNILQRRYFDGTWRPISIDEAYNNWVRSVLDLSKKIQNKGIRIIVLSPLPEFPVSEHLPADACSIQWYRPKYLVSSDCPSNFEVDALMVKTQYSNLRSKLLRIASQSSNLFVYDPLPVLCPNEREVCTADGRFADDNHLSDRGALSLYEDFTAFLRRYNLLKLPAS